MQYLLVLIKPLIPYLIKWLEKFLALLIKNYLKKDDVKMTNTNTFWSSLGQIALAAFASYGSAKLGNKQESWAPYRNQMVQNMAATALSAAIQQFNQQQVQPTTQDNEQPTQQ
jgi:hypothetical protein